MDCYNLMFIPWGYQIMVMSIDNMVLAFVIFVLEIIEFTHFKRLAIEEGDIIYGDGTAGKRFMKVNRDVNVYNANFEGDESYLNDRRDQGAISMDDKQAIENMYMTKQGFRKKLQLESNDTYRNQGKYLEAQEPFNSKVIGRKTQFIEDKRSNEARLLENIVKRLQEERKFNYLQSEPASDKEQSETLQIDSILDPETRALIGKTDGTSLMNENSRRKLAVETTREKIENHLSFRSQYSKSHAKIMDEKVEQEMKKAVYGGKPPLIPSAQVIIEEVPTKILESPKNLQKIDSTHRKSTEIRKSKNNLDSARTEKFNKYSSRKAIAAAT